MNMLLGALFIIVLLFWILWMRVWQLEHEVLKLKLKSLPGKDSEKQLVCCSFCGKKNTEVAMIVSSENALICNECVASCNEIIKAQSKKVGVQAKSTQTP